MAKHRKTRQEKIISDLRRKLQTTNADLPQDSDVISENKISIRNVITKTNTYPTLNQDYNYVYLKHDLSKTAILSLIIILLDLLLSLALKKHVLLPSMGY